jgi:hypothetical protein
MNGAMHMDVTKRSNIALPPPRTWMNHINKCPKTIISMCRELNIITFSS